MVPSSHYNINHLHQNKLLLTICFQLLSFIYLSTKCYLHGTGLQRQACPNLNCADSKPLRLSALHPLVLQEMQEIQWALSLSQTQLVICQNMTVSSFLKFHHAHNTFPHPSIPTRAHTHTCTHTHTHKYARAQGHQRKYGHGIKLNESDATECTRVMSL